MIRYDYFLDCIINPETKVAIVSHNDLDGAGPIIIAKNYFLDCKYFTVSNNSVDKTVNLVLFDEAFCDREVIFITDCSVTDKKLIDLIEQINHKGTRKIFLFDHHNTAIHLNKYDWALVEVGSVSATKLFWQYFQESVADEITTEHFLKIDNLVNKINDWDTWKWTERNDTDCSKLAELFSNTGIEYFLSKYTGDALNDYNRFEIFNRADCFLLKDLENKNKYIIEPGVKRSSRIVEFEFIIPVNGMLTRNFRKVKMCTISSNIGDLAEMLYEPGVDYVMFFYHDLVSVRSRVADLDLGAWAKYIGSGGGHQRAAGFQLSGSTFHIYKNYLFNKFNYKEN